MSFRSKNCFCTKADLCSSILSSTQGRSFMADIRFSAWAGIGTSPKTSPIVKTMLYVWQFHILDEALRIIPFLYLSSWYFLFFFKIFTFFRSWAKAREHSLQTHWNCCICNCANATLCPDEDVCAESAWANASAGTYMSSHRFLSRPQLSSNNIEVTKKSVFVSRITVL